MIEEARARFPGLSLSRLCLLLGVNRGSSYRAVGLGREVPFLLPDRRPPKKEVWLRNAIERLVLEYPGYGYRRVTHPLRKDGFPVNHKRVLRVMHEESLLCQLKRRFVQTTDSEHGHRVYPNLLAQAGWRPLTGINQAWVGEITYIRLVAEFIYLAVLMEAYSRRVVGFALSRPIDGDLVRDALEQALERRQPPAGWIHHSDRGVQYACGRYVERLEEAGARISMSAKGAPRENALAERFFRTLKEEEVYLHEYETYEDAEQSIGPFIEAVYTQKRLHSALGYRPPTEFEQLCATGILLEK